MPENTVYVGRPTKWGNPYEVIQIAGTWTILDTGEVQVSGLTKYDAYRNVRAWFAEAIANGWNDVPDPTEIQLELAGKNLACWCPTDQPCHADVLLELANEVTQ